ARRFKNRFRIVTLDGQVINAGGSMTGGSLDKNIGLLSRRGELEKLREQAKKLSEKAQAQAQELSQLQQKAAADEAALLASQSELVCANEDRVRFEADLRIIREQRERDEAQLAEMCAEQESSRTRIDSLTLERIEAQKKADECAAALSELSRQIEANAGASMKLTSERERLSELLSTAGMDHLSIIKEREAVTARIAELNARIEQGGEREEVIRADIDAINAHIAQLGEQMDSLRGQAASLREQAKAAQEGIGDIQRRRDEMEVEIRDKRKASREAQEQREAVSAERGKLEARMEQTQRDHDSIIARMMEEYNITRREAAEQFSPAENEREAQRTVSELKSKIRALGSVNVGAIEEYKEVSEKYNIYKTQIEDVIKSKNELEKLIADLTVKMQQMFRETFAAINKNFGEIFPELFGGGSAKMILVDDEDCLNCGIDIEITPPGREKRSIMGMSGGEKSIIAVAIYFAIMKVKPSPFCFLDEIDHALDEHNVNNIAQYIKRFTSSTQYVVITHRRGMMEAASMLYGVTKQDGISKLISLQLDEIEEKIGKLE
ncbi:MAG: chromosome segregation protein SMC, partial [Clostridia bacterium]|nr:chromosome segregation protein SMC [Clostridia bacterium]